MSIDTYLLDKSSKVAAEVTDDKELVVSVSTFPAFRRQKAKPFRQYFTDDGLSTGSNDMGVDGSSANVDFYIPADLEDDRYIAKLSFIVAYGAAGKPYQFADTAALTNGTRIFYSTDQGEIDLHDGIKSNQDMFRLNSVQTVTNWEVRHVNGLNDYGYFTTFDLTAVMPPFGVKLDAGTNQRLTILIRDDATNADTFDCIAFGFDRFK